MKASSEIKVSKVRKVSDIGLRSASSLSFFDPYLEYWVKETIEIAGEVHVSRTSAGDLSGIFLYDGYEKDGSVFTRSREVFDYFYKLRSLKSIYAELPTERPKETFDIYTIDLKNSSLDHTFSHVVTVADKDKIDEIRQFMFSTDPKINPKWVEVALNNKDQCVTVRLGDEIAGVGWLSFVNGIGRLHSLFVKPRFRNMGVGLDILFARLLWLKSKGARSAFSEISANNLQSSKTSVKGGMKPSGQVYQYFRTQPPNATNTMARPQNNF
ncbi:MAG TPA: GNAT family N-acetyltransferase [Candidatus Bathyarchaeia archaeon]|nr:GNAT family N-acetyltransferase [Candidatus Bathyarchaeia archaeon]